MQVEERCEMDLVRRVEVEVTKVDVKVGMKAMIMTKDGRRFGAFLAGEF